MVVRIVRRQLRNFECDRQKEGEADVSKQRGL
jgi:hypothetical protein